MTIVETMQRAWSDAQRDRRSATHWLMTFEAYDRLRYESRDFAVAFDRPPEFMGLPIYQTPELEDGSDVMLREGAPPDPEHEYELRRQLAVLHREYQQRARPIVQELAKLEARKPPRPIIYDTTPEQREKMKDRLRGSGIV